MSEAKAFDCRDDIKFGVVDALLDDLKQEYDRVNEQDGVRVDTDDGWVLIRCSNTSPVIRMTIEARDEGTLESMRSDFGKRLMDRIG